MRNAVTTQRPWNRFRLLAGGAALAGALLAPQLAEALPWAPVANPVDPMPGDFVPSADVVPGKDFSDVRDRNAAGAADPEQVVAWDGLGGVRDSFDYSGTRPAGLAQDIEVDGIGAGGDALFQSLRDNQSAMIFSVENDPNILFERNTGGGAIWATAAQIDTTNPPIDTDGIELWGGNQNDDSDRYSLAGDPVLPGTGRVAIWAFTPAAGPSAPHTLTAELAAAMDLQFGGPGVGGNFYSQLLEQMDVDAIMTFGPQVTFSIRPISIQVPGPAPTFVNFDGGEIFEYTSSGVATKFLNHGGHLWDTAFDVRGTFSVNSENIDALEAASVPEPASAALILLGFLAAPGVARRRRR